MKIDVLISPTAPIAQQAEFFVIEWMKRVGDAHLLRQLGHKRCSSVDSAFRASVAISVPPAIRKEWWNSGNGSARR